MASIESAKEEIDRLLSSFDQGRMMREGVRAVIAGSPNVGKSTLMNLLSRCERSIVTDVPGTTRDVVEQSVIFASVPMILSDTAGIRGTADRVEAMGVELSRRRMASADLILLVFDSSRALSEDDVGLIAATKGRPRVAVINKTDLARELDEEYIRSHIENTVCISALDGTGTKQLEEAVKKVLLLNRIDPRAAMLFNERQRLCARDALAAVEDAAEALKQGCTLDAISAILDDAVAALLSLTGERVTDAVVDEVFSRFCVGK